MTDSLRAETIRITGHGGDEIEAYLAQPLDEGRYGGVVVIHHMPGYDESTREITRKFAAHGYLAVCPNLYSREAPGPLRTTPRRSPGRSEEFPTSDSSATSRAPSTSSSRSSPRTAAFATIGYCSGGRQSFLAACSLPLDAAVDCYGAFVVGTPPEGMPLKVGPIVHMTKDLSCPLLGLFGAEDQYPSPEQVAELEEALKQAGKTYEFHSYEGAGHAFFATDRPSYRPEAANDGWQRIWDFFGRYLAS